MSKSVPAIRSVKARALVVPLKRPVKNAFGVIDSGPLVLIGIGTDQGVTGHSYIFAYARLTLKPLVHLIEEIGRELVGKAVAPFDLMAAGDALGRVRPARPDQHGPIFIHREPLALNEFGLQVLQIVVIHVELALERAIRQAPTALQEGNRLIEEFLKGHR